jgi:hypothetical protein
MKSRTPVYVIIGLLIFSLVWFAVSTGSQQPTQVFPATINRDCAPWDGAAFTVSVPYDATSTIMISIWQSPDINRPSRFSLPDKGGSVGNVVSVSPSGEYKQLKGTVSFGRVEEGMPVEGEFSLTSDGGEEFTGSFEAQWGNKIVYCG